MPVVWLGGACTVEWKEVLTVLHALALLVQTFGEGVHKVKVYHHYAYYVEAAPPFRYVV
jgi:hypothetical protein